MFKIEINIENSFNKKDNYQENKNVSDDFSTLNQNSGKMITETSSLSTTSITNNDRRGFVTNELKDKKSSILRDIFVGVTGTIIGAIVTYLILGIK